MVEKLYLWSGWCIERLYIRKGLMSSPCEGNYSCSWLYLYGTWLERYRYIRLRDMFEDVCTGHNYMLHTMIGYRLSWQEATKCLSFRKSEKPLFQNAYTGCSTYRPCTYAGCSIDRARTYTHYRTDRSCICWI